MIVKIPFLLMCYLIVTVIVLCKNSLLCGFSHFYDFRCLLEGTVCISFGVLVEIIVFVVVYKFDDSFLRFPSFI